MDWTQALTVIGVFIGGFIYLMSKMNANQKENNTRFNRIKNRLTAIEVETKNTNQRLSSIETENKDISKRLSNIEGYLAPNKVFHFDAPHKEDEPKEN